jgi:hypothetical protein
MKGKILLLLVLIFMMLVPVAFADEEEDLIESLRRAREHKHRQREAAKWQDALRRKDFDMLTIYSYRDAIKTLEQSKETIRQCLQYDDEIMLQVQYGRFISAFELCRKQGKGIQECIQKVQEAKEKWRQRCNKDLDAKLRLLYYRSRLNAEEIKTDLKKRIELTPVYQYGMGGGGLAALAQREIFAILNQMLSNQFPGSQFDLKTGTGYLVVPGATLYYQGWRFIRGDYPTPIGMLIQVFENRMNFVAGNYNIAVNLPPNHGWEIVEFNLPFDSQTEQILLAFGRGVRLTNKEIIDLVNGYLHNTVWEVDLPLTFQKLLLEAAERRFFFESLVEFYAYDSYLNKVKAEEARLKQQLTQTRQETQPQALPQTQTQPKTKKTKGTRK